MLTRLCARIPRSCALFDDETCWMEVTISQCDVNVGEIQSPKCRRSNMDSSDESGHFPRMSNARLYASNADLLVDPQIVANLFGRMMLATL